MLVHQCCCPQGRPAAAVAAQPHTMVAPKNSLTNSFSMFFFLLLSLSFFFSEGGDVLWSTSLFDIVGVVDDAAVCLLYTHLPLVNDARIQMQCAFVWMSNKCRVYASAAVRFLVCERCALPNHLFFIMIHFSYSLDKMIIMRDFTYEVCMSDWEQGQVENEIRS